MNDEEGSDHDDVYDVRKIYWDSDGNLRHGEAFCCFLDHTYSANVVEF